MREDTTRERNLCATNRVWPKRSLGELSDQHRTRSREEVFGRLVDERGSDGEMSSQDESIAALLQHTKYMCPSEIDGDVVFAPSHFAPK